MESVAYPRTPEPFLQYNIIEYTMRTILSDQVRVLYYASTLVSFLQSASAFTSTSQNNASNGSLHRLASSSTSTPTTLAVSVGLGPEQAVEEEEGEGQKELEAGVDYEIPVHEDYRTSRRSKLDEQCDQWFGALLGDEDDHGVLGSLADDARKILLTPVPLTNQVRIAFPFDSTNPCKTK